MYVMHATLASIRLFLPIPMDYNPKYKDWSYISLSYLKAFDETDLPVKAITTTLGADLGNEESAFFKYSHLFVRDFGEITTNIVLGFGGVFEKFYTEGMKNIAITASYPRPQREEEVRALKKYSSVWAITQRTQIDLQGLGYEAGLVPPEPLIIKVVLARIEA